MRCQISDGNELFSIHCTTPAEREHTASHEYQAEVSRKQNGERGGWSQRTDVWKGLTCAVSVFVHSIRIKHGSLCLKGHQLALERKRLSLRWAAAKRPRERESVCVCVRERERERECVCVYDEQKWCARSITSDFTWRRCCPPQGWLLRQLAPQRAEGRSEGPETNPVRVCMCVVCAYVRVCACSPVLVHVSKGHTHARTSCEPQ